ncbi:NAD-dependent epimerase/dehydratase family protein [Fulvivirgaceae bacterium BMA12]|uniref:NAD-dependent epimerase/dehydratase family protein n=1 Tax=Agaribacillus aureus TaxID=3051825 RepID=A0ABT8L156_9BACT|nr:NAD-dependent epimerase/dehydratase family protein [Fulvivirgaceae bacterium BMA12]
MSKILVTGNAGFIGMHTVMALRKQGHSIFGLDNINEYYDKELKYERLQQQGIPRDQIAYGKAVKANENLSFLHLNLEEKERIHELFESERFDYVVHLAAQAGVRYSIENPDVYIESNILGFLNILEGCRNFDAKHLVFASSSSVYGLNSEIPFKESHATEHPVSLYAATKKSNEMMAHCYSYLYNIPVTGLRFFTVYGPWGRPDMALFKFTKNIIEDKPIDVYNHGDMKRDFTYVDDIVDGIVKTFTQIPQGVEKSNLPTNHSKAPYVLYNIGNSKPVKLMDFIEAIEEAIGKKAKINYLPLQPGDVNTTYADVDNLKNSTGYIPSISVKEGVKQFVEWYKDYFSQNK